MRTGERAPPAPVDRMSNADRRHRDIPGANAHDAGRPEECRHTFESDTGPAATEYDATFDAEEDIAGKGAVYGGLDVSAGVWAHDGRTSAEACRGENAYWNMMDEPPCALPTSPQARQRQQEERAEGFRKPER